MLRNPTPGELKTAVTAAPDSLGGFVWKHKNGGGLYRVETLALCEADLAPVVVYRNEGGTAFTRPAAEFFDGRFSPILAPHVLRMPDAAPEDVARIRERLERLMGEGKVEIVPGASARDTLIGGALRFELVKEHAARIAAERARDQANMLLMSIPFSPLAGFRDTAVEAIAAERNRQIDVEGFTPEHDARHRDGSIFFAAQSYFLHAIGFPNPAVAQWPWDLSWWKPTTTTRDLEKAGALCLAEQSRALRAGLLTGSTHALFSRIVAELATILASTERTEALTK